MLAAAAVVLALTVLTWAYGVYCYVQMVGTSNLAYLRFQ